MLDCLFFIACTHLQSRRTQSHEPRTIIWPPGRTIGPATAAANRPNLLHRAELRAYSHSYSKARGCPKCVTMVDHLVQPPERD